jgi:hypothetical protein
MRFILAIALALCLSFGARERAWASTIYVDASVGGSNPFTSYCPSSCLNDYLSPLYSFHAGDTVNFGTLELFSFVLPSRTGIPFYTVQGNYEVSYGPIEFVSDDFISGPFPTFLSEGSTSVDPVLAPPLVFTFAADTEFQLAWTSGVDYTPASPVPEPSTWAMMILGFLGIGVMAFRLRNHVVDTA